MTDIKAGDRVAYRAAFLRNIADYSHASASRRGTVVSVNAEFADSPPLARVRWDDGNNQIGGCLVKHLIRADRIHLEPA